jgi:tetratricopeptide (TPR) repeat protein
MDSLRSSRDRVFHAPLHLRLGQIRLHAALLEDAATLVPRIVGEPADLEEVLPRLLDALDLQLSGRPADRPVLEALPLAARAAAAAEVTAALQADPTYAPALQAAAALAVVAGRWPEAIAWYERLARHAADAETAGVALMAIGDVLWRKLAQPEPARERYQESRAVLGDAPLLLDKLLKLDLELERWPTAIETCRRLLELLQNGNGRSEAAVTYLLTLGEIHLYGLQDPAASLGYYLDAISAAPAYDLAFTLLQELLESADRAKLLASLPGDADLPEERRRVGTLLNDVLARLDKPAAAVAELRKILAA